MIDNRLNDNRMRADLIERINKTFRTDFIRIPESSIGTINPDYYGNNNDHGGIEIYGNSIGAYDLHAYFNSECRILYVLKEPYIPKKSFDNKDNPDRGGHNQTEEYAEYSYEDFDYENKTYAEIIRNCYSIVTKKEFIPDASVIEHAMRIFHNNVSIINVNYFPAVKTTKSNNTFIGRWAAKNEEILTMLFRLYNPTIIVGGNTLTALYHHECNDKGLLFNENVSVLWHDEIIRLTQTSKLNRDSYYNPNHLFLNLVHPSYCPRNSQEKQYWKEIRTAIIKLVDWWENGRA